MPGVAIAAIWVGNYDFRFLAVGVLKICGHPFYPRDPRPIFPGLNSTLSETKSRGRKVPPRLEGYSPPSSRARMAFWACSLL